MNNFFIDLFVSSPAAIIYTMCCTMSWRPTSTSVQYSATRGRETSLQSSARSSQRVTVMSSTNIPYSMTTTYHLRLTWPPSTDTRRRLHIRRADGPPNTISIHTSPTKVETTATVLITAGKCFNLLMLPWRQFYQLWGFPRRVRQYKA